MAGRPPKNGVAKSATTEIVYGRGADSFKKAAVNLKEAIAAADSLESRFEDLALKVANKEEELASIDEQIAEKRRKATLDFEMELRESKLSTINDVLAEQGKMSVGKTDYQSLQESYTKLQADFVTQVRAEVGKAEGIAKSRFENELKLKESEFKATAAGNTAEIESLKKEVAFLNTQISKWETALVEERKAGVERAKASSIGSVNLGSDTGTSRR
jgi:hypothetical protein